MDQKAFRNAACKSDCGRSQGTDLSRKDAHAADARAHAAFAVDPERDIAGCRPFLYESGRAAVRHRSAVGGLRRAGAGDRFSRPAALPAHRLVRGSPRMDCRSLRRFLSGSPPATDQIGSRRRSHIVARPPSVHAEKNEKGIGSRLLAGLHPHLGTRGGLTDDLCAGSAHESGCRCRRRRPLSAAPAGGGTP
ncbi:MAG: hypothetical protein BWY83_01466 [bacterium ADurb.Bin478]|nr:MAG: hypothetical protein BWY83_01466 [bacterium ADurb.Bin478]